MRGRDLLASDPVPAHDEEVSVALGIGQRSLSAVGGRPETDTGD